MEAKSSVPCEPHLHFKFPCIEEGDPQKGHLNTLPIPPGVVNMLQYCGQNIDAIVKINTFLNNKISLDMY